MPFNRESEKNRNNDRTRELLDTAITSIVQAIGSKAGVLVFWDSRRNSTGHISHYGLTQGTFEELLPVITDLVGRLNRGENFYSGTSSPANSPDELPALKVDVPASAGMFQVIALPIQNEGRFFAAVCLVQAITPGGILSPGADTPALPPGPGVGIEVRAPEDGEESSGHASYNLVEDLNEVIARNAQMIRQLVAEKQWLNAIISYSADGILIVDNGCDIIGFNPAFARLSGYSVEELRGQNCTEALKFKTLQGAGFCGLNCPVKVNPALQKVDLECRSEVELLTKDGQKRFVELNYSVILSSHNEILGGIIGARDITARKEAEELQSTFLSVISHELQTPISIIKGYAGLFADEKTKFETSEVREKMQIIQEESDRLSKLVENLLYASRLQAGGIELQRYPLDLINLIERVVQKMKRVSNSHKISSHLPDYLPKVSADYDKIQQVLVNLIENAIKYSPKGGAVTLEAAHTSEEVIVTVKDEGIGVPESEREHIFDRFSRLDSRYVRERKGAGLGLYICKAIIEAHGGRIWVEPPGLEGNQRGSHFNFSLPRVEPAALPVLFGKL